MSSDEDSCEDHDQVQSHDPGAHKDFHSTQIESVQFDSAFSLSLSDGYTLVGNLLKGTITLS